MHHDYEQEQHLYWTQLRQELMRYKTELGATNFELAQCLGISRQPLVSFMQGDRGDLPINRAHLKQLWDLLTDPDWMQDKKLSAEERIRREALRRVGPNSLLKAAGFVPDTHGQSIDVEPERYQHIQRIISSLSSVPDFTDFIRLADSLETELITRFFGFRDLSKSSAKQKSDLSWKMSHKEIRKWVKQWSKNNLYKQPTAQVKDKFERAITKLVISGKYDLEDAEIFELYISILEKERLSQNIPGYLKLKITQCQFKTLTFSLLDFAFNCNENIEKQLYKAGVDAEKSLRYFDQETDYIDEMASDVVLEAFVTGYFKDNCNEEICWRYSSSATHFENMLAAIARGTGYETKLEMIDLSIHSLGNSDSSLVKASVTFQHDELGGSKRNIYQSVWVDRSAINATAKSVAFAVTNWLAECLSTPESIKNYRQLCQDLATIDHDLNQARQALNDYVIRRPEQLINVPVREYLKEKVITKIEQLQATSLKQSSILARWYGALLEHRYCMAKLWCSHSSSVQGELETAISFLGEAESSFNRSGLEHYVPLQILINTERMLHQFYGGEREFLSKKMWRSQQDEYLQKLHHYIYEDVENSTFRKYCDRLEFDIYLCASDLFGRIGRLDFSLTTWEDSEFLEQSVSNLLMAAHYAAKIGSKQRAAHWITTVSRAYCRLNDREKAKGFANVAERMIERSINQRYSSKYRDSIKTEVNLARGERFLLIENDQSMALKHFLMALKGATYLGFTRVISESLYGIARASMGFDRYKVETTFEDAFTGKNLDNPLQEWKFKVDKQGWTTNPISNSTIKFVNELNKQSDWGNVSEQFQCRAKAIWHNWAVAIYGVDAVHPLEAEIESHRFLNRVR